VGDLNRDGRSPPPAFLPRIGARAANLATLVFSDIHPSGSIMATGQNQGHSTSLPGLTPHVRLDISEIRQSTEVSLGVYVDQQAKEPRRNDEASYRRKANQSAVVLADLRELRQRVREVRERARARRARRWFTGLAMYVNCFAPCIYVPNTNPTTKGDEDRV
jgi:hypothetical protein